MIDHVSTAAVASWFAFGFFAGLGWTLASWLLNQILSRF